MNKSKDFLYTESDDGLIATISFNRPKHTITFEMLEEMDKCIQERINSFKSKVRVLILKSEGKHFTVGLDIATVSQISNGAKDINAEEDDNDDGKDDSARKSIRIEEFTISYL